MRDPLRPCVLWNSGRIPINPGSPLSQAAIGALITGTIAMAFPQILGEGSYNLQEIISGEMPLLLLATIGLLKMVVTEFSIGSGGSGGVFGPSLFAIVGDLGHDVRMEDEAHALVGEGDVLRVLEHDHIVHVHRATLKRYEAIDLTVDRFDIDDSRELRIRFLR